MSWRVSIKYFIVITVFALGSSLIGIHIKKAEIVKASETTIDGIWYASNLLPAHGQNIGTQRDIGTLSRSKPTSENAGSRSCAEWTQYDFDADISFVDSREVKNIYYHLWFQSQGNAGTLGYTTSTAYNGNTLSSLSVDHNSAVTKLNDFYLASELQTLSTPLTLTTNSSDANYIYKFSVKYDTTNQFPATYSAPNQYSYVILNIPDDIQTQGFLQNGDIDYDNDGLSDYDELYIYYSNPYEADTDSDQFSDGFEVASSMNPNDPESAPSFGNNVFREYYGSNTGDQISSAAEAGDLNEDSTSDILIGAPLSDVEGLPTSNEGYATAISPTTGETIFTIHGARGGGNLGTSIINLGDLDDVDLLNDFAVSEPGMLGVSGKIYVYSSANVNEPLVTITGNFGLGTILYSIDNQDEYTGKDIISINNNPVFGNSLAIYSSKTGNLIREYFPEEDNEDTTFPGSVSSIEDYDQDGKIDFAVVDDGLSRIQIFGSASDVPLKTIDISSYGTGIGSLQLLDDLNEDSINDFAIGQSASQRVLLISADDGSLIREIANAQYDGFGDHVVVVDDQNFDGAKDIIVSASAHDFRGSNESGAAFVYSVIDGTLLWSGHGPQTDIRYGSVLLSLDDINNNGVGEFAILAPQYSNAEKSKVGALYIYSDVENKVPESFIWAKGSSQDNALDLDYFFHDHNNDTLPSPNQNTTYTIIGNSKITVSINSNTKLVSFTAPSWWAGSETIKIRATDPTGLYSESNSIVLTVNGAIETTPPVTSLRSNPSSPNGESGYYIESKPIIVLDASDSGSGVYKTFYRWQGQNSYTEYSGSITALEGNNMLYYYSEDNAGNVEAAKSSLFKVDSAGPDIQMSSPQCTWCSVAVKYITISGAIKDDGSGLDSLAVGNQMITSPENFNLIYELKSGLNVISLTAIDKAGNESKIYLYVKRNIYRFLPLGSTDGILTADKGISSYSTYSFADMETSSGNLKEGEIITVNTKKPVIKGKTLPNHFVDLEIHSKVIKTRLISDLEGYWSYQPEEDLEVGDHAIMISIKDQNEKEIERKLFNINIVETAAASEPAIRIPELPAPTKGSNWLIYTICLGISTTIALYYARTRYENRHLH